MFTKLMTKLTKAKTTEELLKYKTDILSLYKSIYKKVKEEPLNITNYDDIRTLYELEQDGRMAAYFGISFYRDCGVPFLKEHNPITIQILQLSVLFYSLQILNLLEKGFWKQVSLCIHKELYYSMGICDGMENINLTEPGRYKRSVFLVLWDYFSEMITMKPDESEIVIGEENTCDYYSISSEEYEYVLHMIYTNYRNIDTPHA